MMTSERDLEAGERKRRGGRAEKAFLARSGEGFLARSGKGFSASRPNVAAEEAARVRPQIPLKAGIAPVNIFAAWYMKDGLCITYVSP